MQTLHHVFSALGDPTRLAIIERLLRDGEASAGSLQDIAAISAPAFSRHLKVLYDAKIVTRRVEQQKRIYAVRPEALLSIGSWTIAHREYWQSSLDRLDNALSRERKMK